MLGPINRLISDCSNLTSLKLTRSEESGLLGFIEEYERFDIQTLNIW